MSAPTNKPATNKPAVKKLTAKQLSARIQKDSAALSKLLTPAKPKKKAAAKPITPKPKK